MTKDAEPKDWTGLLTTSAGVLYSDPANVPGGGSADPAVTPSYSSLILLCPRPPGASGVGPTDGLESDNRIFTQLTGWPYCIPVQFHGGCGFLTEVNVTNAPAGFVSRQTTYGDKLVWELYWANPTAGTHSNIAVEIVDGLGATSSRTYTLVVNTTDKFVVNASTGNDSTGAGTRASPWLTINHACANATPMSQIYFEGGTYPITLSGTEFSDTPNHVLRFSGDVTAHALIGDPAAPFTIDHGANPGVDGDMPGMYFDADGSSWISHGTLDGATNHCFYQGDDSTYGSMAFAVNFTNFGHGWDGYNAGAISITQSLRRGGGAIGCTWDGMVAQVGADGQCFIKMYGNQHYTVLGGTVTNSATNVEGGFAIKNAVAHLFMADTTTEGLAQWIGGNYHDDDTFGGSIPCSGDFLYCKALGGPDLSTAYTGLTNCAGSIRTFGVPRDAFNFGRCSIIGQFLIESAADTDAGFLYERCVFSNNENASSPQPFIFDDNLWSGNSAVNVQLVDCVTGTVAQAKVDANGDLQGSYRTANGPGSGDDCGWERP
jgi:hypothetical protein